MADSWYMVFSMSRIWRYMDSIAPNFETAMLADNLIHLPYVRTTSLLLNQSTAWHGLVMAWFHISSPKTLGLPGFSEQESVSWGYLAVGGGSLRSASMLRRPKCAALMSLSSVAAGPEFVCHFALLQIDLEWRWSSYCIYVDGFMWLWILHW